MPINAVNLTGTIFPAGPKGETGPANNLEIGTVEKGIEASATITGDAPNQILNLVLPKGDKGEKGDTGSTNSLEIGTVERGTEASATITGDAPNQVLNLVLPTGETAEIEALKAKHAQEISALENLIPTGQASGESIDLNDSAEYKFKKFGISGNSKQETRSGKNKADINNYYYDTISYSDLNISLNNGEFTISTDGAKNLTEYIRIPTKINSNGTYTFGIDLKTNKAGDTAQALVYDYTNKKVIGKVFTNTDINYITKTQQITIDDSIDKDNILIFLYCPYDGTVGQAYSFSYKNIFFNEGTNTEYEPYGAMPSPEFPSEIKNVTGNVKVKIEGKNRFDGKFEIAEYDSSGNKATTTVWAVNKNIINVKPNTTYTVSQKETPTQYRIICFNDNEFLQWITSTQDLTNGYKSYTFTTPEKCNKIYIQFRSTLEVIATGTYDMTTDSITEAQLEEGTEATDYEPYKSQVVTFPLGEEKLMEGSYLADNGIHHKRKQVVFDGSDDENWVYNDTVKRFFITITNMKRCNVTEGIGKSVCNIFIYNTEIWGDYNVQYGYVTNNGQLIVRNLDYNSVEEFKTALSTNPMLFEYELAEEEIEPYTAEQQEVYDKIKELYSYKGTTHITCEDEVSCIFQAEYYKDLETILNNMQAQILAE